MQPSFAVRTTKIGAWLVLDFVEPQQVQEIQPRHMLEEVNNKLRHQLEELDIGKLLEAYLATIMSVIMLICNAEYVLIVQLLLGQLLQMWIMMTKEIHFLQHLLALFKHLCIWVMRILCLLKVAQQMFIYVLEYHFCLRTTFG